MPLVGVVGLGGNLLSVAVLSGASYLTNSLFNEDFSVGKLFISLLLLCLLV